MSTGNPSLARIGDYLGMETGVSDWIEVTQEQVDSFAEVTDDHQWIHQSQPETLTGPFGGPVAHGLLVLSIAFKLAREAEALPQSTWIIYGYDKLRFRAPVRIGKRIRCRTTVLNVCHLGQRVLLTVRFKVEIEGEIIPALVADCSLLCLNDQEDISTPDVLREDRTSATEHIKIGPA